MSWRGRMPPALATAAAISLVLALVSLALPSGPGYDPYAWLLWGRDLAHLGLSVGGTGTSWKPLPALIDALLAPLGRNASDGWIVVSRAGALFAVFMAGRVAWRLAPQGFRPVGAAVAAATLLLTHQWVRIEGVGNSEGLMAAFGLLAVDRHLDRRHGQALAWMVAAGMIRVEVWPFLGAYALWLAWRSRGWMRPAAVLGALLAPVFWFGGDWVGSGHLTTAADRALVPIPGSPGASPHPALAVASDAVTMVPLPAWIAIAAGLAAALLRRRLTPVPALTACAVAWTAVVAAMAERGYGGLPRFVFGASALEAVAAGIGAAIAAAWLARGRRAAVGGLSALALAAFALGSVPDARLLPQAAAGIDRVADTDAELAAAVSSAGGPGAVMRCGTPSAPWYTVTAIAWDLGVTPDAINRGLSGPVEFKQSGGGWAMSEARRCRLVAAQSAQVRHGAAHEQRAHHHRNA
ncbi:MAG TPA: hypothetical protein VH247_04615 [Thermoleophilaceae bacterium]|nr:hypothetical protein [Thermoleophilaceae bacterium]